MCRSPQGPRFPMGYSPPPNPIVPCLSLVSAQRWGLTITTRWDSLGLPVPPLISFVVSQICCQSSRGLHAVHKLYRRPYSQSNLIYQHRNGERNTDESLKWERSSVTGFKNTVGYVTLYHYNSPLKALPRHLAYVWTWNWIRLCGKLLQPPVWEGTGQSTLYRWN